MSIKWTPVLLLLQLGCFFSPGRGGKVLVWPMEYSHWINIKTILDELAQRTFLTSLSGDDYEVFFKEAIRKLIYDLPNYSFWTYFSLLQEIVWKDSDFIESICRDVVFNKTLVTKLQESKSNIVLADGLSLCGELLAELLRVPLVYTLRFTPGYTYEKYSGGLLFPPSYVPIVYSELTDQMTFLERVKNMLHVLYFDFWPTTLTELMGKAEMWLIRTYWDVEFPRPLLPNVDFVGGLHCRLAKPLPKEMEAFVQSSGEEGVVVFSLGSMVSNMTEERATVIASTLGQLPQKVVWRFDGKKPDALGRNTRLYKWIPQNDLLGHPKTKAFIIHGGTNGIYEAIYHGIPMVGIPLFADQPNNVVHMKAKGAAVRLNLNKMSATDFVTILCFSFRYKENALKLSRIHHDQPMKPLDRAVFWIEFVTRHKGAKHLRVAAHDLTWLQYHSLDVIGFLLACVATLIFIFTKCCLFCFRKYTKTQKKNKKE
uniref:glucuronosyltransferase n=1 Tax=Oryctolagus cuniculus TaxID=9986 RepID=G1TTR6_RABIT